jgi:dipeptidyl aminopeptidase/acylaminoacyl peptidase
MARTSPFGTWASPVTLDRLVEHTVGLAFPIATAGHVYWTEVRPQEAGRHVLVRAAVVPRGTGAQSRSEHLRRCGPEPRAEPDVVIPQGFNARSTVYEYGGMCTAVHAGPFGGDVVCFSNFSDQRVYKVAPGRAPVPITPEPPSERAWRYVAPVFTPDGGHLIIVRERHGDPDVPSAVVNDVVIASTDGTEAPRTILSGHDFYSHLALAPDGRRLCWVSWDHPSMPWDGTELWEGELDVEAARVLDARRIAGGGSESVTQPKYAPDGTLHYVSDRTGWWNLYAVTPDGANARVLAPMEAELAVPDFAVGISSYALLRDGSVLATWRRSGLSEVGVLRPGAEAFERLDTGFSHVSELRGADDGSSAVAVAGSAVLAPSIVRIVPGERRGSRPAIEILRRSREDVIDPRYLSAAEPVDVPTEEGEVVHALYYAPTNPDFGPPDGELPPLIVNAHGGPTSAAVPVLNYAIQFWTSRGFALVDVNYGGSAGYGRAYRERLRGRWGVVDVHDCVAVARHLVATGRADGRRLLIHGGSAGGYTALCASAFSDVFAAAASYYGIADLVALAEETHKFESHYVDVLVGPWPEAADVYRARSPALHPERLRTPLILFQGLEDPIVPPRQAETMVAALRANGVPHAYVAYEGEQHGFRRAEHLRRSAEAELYFYGRVLGFSPADELVPIEIVHEDRVAPLPRPRDRS